MLTLVETISQQFPLNEADQAKINSLEANGSTITFAAVVHWLYNWDNEDEAPDPTRVTSQIVHPELVCYADNSEDLADIIDRIDQLEGQYWNRLQDKHGLPSTALYLDTAYVKHNNGGTPDIHLSDIFLVKVLEMTC